MPAPISRNDRTQVTTVLRDGQAMFEPQVRQDAPSARPPAPAVTVALGDLPPPVRGRQERYKLVVDLVADRIYVVAKDTGEPIDRYLTSPGGKKYPTEGDRFTITRALLRPSWTPPPSKWAQNLKPAPPGLANPLGIFALDLGGYHQYIHGVPAHERRFLGQPVSHGCLRMSNENVLHLFRNYAGIGSEVVIVRDKARSRELSQRFHSWGGQDHKVSDGAEFVPAAVAGKLRLADG